MLTRFEVTNFKQFKDTLVLDFSDTRQYAFNPECVVNGVVNKALIYGPNGCGKSNLGYAIVDLVRHLTDTDKTAHGVYLNGYTNANSVDECAQFKYSFIFNNSSVVYEYKKNDLSYILHERLYINNKLMVEYYFGRPFSSVLSGTETLHADLGGSQISVLKYIRRNAVLTGNEDNRLFNEFFNFVEKMLFFGSLDQNMFIGYDNTPFTILEDILDKGHLPEFNEFLNRAGVACDLDVAPSSYSNKDIVFKFKNKSIPFYDIASNGTKALALFYAWYQRLQLANEISFVFIDEFDAFYHHSLSWLIVELLKSVDSQVILTTHNTNLIDNDLLRPDCYFIMSPDSIKSLPNCTDKELREAHNLEKMYRAGVFSV